MNFNFQADAFLPQEINEVGSILQSSKQHFEKLQQIVDELGYRSAKAQQLPHTITDLRGALSNKQRIYLLRDNTAESLILGFIKVGEKNLFLFDHHGSHNELSPLCVLDFYVHEDYQRRGCGLKLFNHMLRAERVEAKNLAIDRPSKKFISFLKKHFNLWSTIPQVNNFVIFDGFFHGKNRANSRNHRRGGAGGEEMQHKKWNSVWGRHTSLGGITPQWGNNDSNGWNKQHQRKRWNDDIFGSRPNSHFNLPAARAEQNNNNSRNTYSRYAYNRNTFTPTPTNNQATVKSQTIPSCTAAVALGDDKRDEQKLIYSQSSTQLKNAEQNITNTNQVTTTSFHSRSATTNNRPIRSAPLSKYQNPSDMIAELQNKDAQTKGNGYRWYENRTSSWNIFGIQ